MTSADDPETIILLSKTPYDEPRDGGALRTRAVADQLAHAGGWRVTPVVAVDPRRRARRPSAPAARVAVLLLANVRVLWAFLQMGSITSLRWYRPGAVADAVHAARTGPRGSVIEHTQLMGYLPVLARPVVLDMHNVESELMANYARSTSVRWRRLLAEYEARRLRRVEQRVLRDVASVSAVSQRDRDILLGLARPDHPTNSARVVVAPNGVGEDGFTASPDKVDEVVFVAHLGWAPNIEAAEWLVREVWPHVRKTTPALRLALVGRSPARRVRDLAAHDVRVVGDVESVVEYVARARVATAPLLAAGGTRLKILEALSCGTPVVATALGALGLERLAGPSLAIADDAAAFALAITQLAGDQPAVQDTRALATDFRWVKALEPLVSVVHAAFRA